MFQKALMMLALISVVLGVVFSHMTGSRSPASSEEGLRIVRWVENLPLGSRLSDYLMALGVAQHGAGHGGANEGLAAFNNQMLTENPCFAELATRFYDEIKIRDLEYFEKDVKSHYHRPTLNDRLTTRTDPKAGFLWNRALEFANQDKNLAMHLIGICGHDDAVSVETKFVHYHDAQVSRRKEEAFSNAVELRKMFAKALTRHDQNVDADKISRMVMLSSERCPMQNSAMYLPGALDSQADIEEGLKIRIGESQAPNKGLSALPAKAYHVLGAAATTCLLYQRGVPSLLASEIHDRAVGAYRATTFCRMIGLDVQTGKRVALKNDLTDKVPAFVSDVESNQGPCVSAVNGSDIFDERDLLNEVYCRLSNEQRSSPDVVKLMNVKLARADAAYMVSQTAGYRSTENCREIDLNSGIQTSLDSPTAIRCLPHWSKERCRKAMSVISGWSADFQWTREQHRAGERFARKHCQSLGSQNRLASACSALERLQRQSRVHSDSLEENGVQ